MAPSFELRLHNVYYIGKHISCTLFYTSFCTLLKKGWNNAFFVPSVQGQVRDGISSDNNSVQVDGIIPTDLASIFFAPQSCKRSFLFPAAFCFS